MTQNEIERRAYELYEQRGREDGYDRDDWLLAETQLRRAEVRAAANVTDVAEVPASRRSRTDRTNRTAAS